MKKIFYLLVLTSCFFGCGNKDKTPPVTPDPPTMIISSIALFEGDATSTFTFKVNLSRASDQTITVDYATANGTAATGTDYIAKSGTLTFKPQTTEGSIEITVVGDTIKEADETFDVVLSNVANAKITTAVGTATIRNDDTYIYIPPTATKRRRLTRVMTRFGKMNSAARHSMRRVGVSTLAAAVGAITNCNTIRTTDPKISF